MKLKKYLTAPEAAQQLEVKLATLYAYVSRGLIRSEMVEDGSRERRYLREDVEKLTRQRENRRDPAKAVQSALHWGTPVMDSALTLIENGKLYYRGYDVAHLAIERSFEEVAALLWLDDFAASALLFSASSASLQPQVYDDLPPILALQVALARGLAEDVGAYELTSEAVTRTGVKILKLMMAVLTGEGNSQPTIAATLAAKWCPDKVHLLNAALIACADHELNASSFTARVVAGVDANPYAVVMAGLAALQGYKHGKNTEQVAAFVREVGEARYARIVIAERLQRGEKLAGFGHWLYQDEDPRATVLLTLLRQSQHPDDEVMKMIEAIIEETHKVIGKAPNIDFALVAVEYALRLPRGAALMLFALGRTAGWIAHALEQSGEMIRPRARYVGRLPETN
jgi:citrate synthase